MINNLEVSKRLQKLIEFYGESASSFAERIGVQRSSISHILSGRNKPSLDFVMKVLKHYPEVELYWLLNGKGNFPSLSAEIEQMDDVPSISTSSSDRDTSQIERIVIFYMDGSFKSYQNPENSD